MNNEMMKIFNDHWRETKERLRKQAAEIVRITAIERAEVAGAVPHYDTVGDLPSTITFAGQVASVAGVLYQHDGDHWRQYMPISVGLTSAVADPVDGMLNVDPANNRLSYYDSGWVGVKRTDE